MDNLNQIELNLSLCEYSETKSNEATLVNNNNLKKLTLVITKNFT